MKRILLLLLGIFFAFSAAACASDRGNISSDPVKTNASSSENTYPVKGKTLVVYYSESGHTKQVAEYIASKTGADLIRLIPEKPYTEDDLIYRDNASRVIREHETPSFQDVKLVNAKADHWDSYDTVFIGFPIWWQRAAWPVHDFIKSNGFTGKTVIPFATSLSSPIGDSSDVLRDMAKGGSWQEGRCFNGIIHEKEVDTWLKSLSFEK